MCQLWYRASLRLTACLVTVFVLCPGNALASQAAVQAGAAPAEQVYIAPFTGVMSPPDAWPGGAQSLANKIQDMVTSAMLQKYPCADISDSQALAAIIGFNKQRDLLGATTPEQQEELMHGVAGALGSSTIVLGRYELIGNTLSVTVLVEDAASGTTVDADMESAAGNDPFTLFDLAKGAVDKLSIGLCRSYWTGMVSIITHESGGSSKAGKSADSGTMTVTKYTYESVSLSPPKSLMSNPGDLSEPRAAYEYQARTEFHSIGTLFLLDSCKGALQNIAYTNEGTLKISQQDTWRDTIGVAVNRSTGKYVIHLNGHDVPTQQIATSRASNFSKKPCGKVEQHPPAFTSGLSQIAGAELSGEVDPKNPYKLEGKPPEKKYEDEAGTITVNESWSLTLRNPRRSGTP